MLDIAARKREDMRNVRAGWCCCGRRIDRTNGAAPKIACCQGQRHRNDTERTERQDNTANTRYARYARHSNSNSSARISTAHDSPAFYRRTTGRKCFWRTRSAGPMDKEPLCLAVSGCVWLSLSRLSRLTTFALLLRAGD